MFGLHCILTALPRTEYEPFILGFFGTHYDLHCFSFTQWPWCLEFLTNQAPIKPFARVFNVFHLPLIP
jgi:hypothetical protein